MLVVPVHAEIVLRDLNRTMPQVEADLLDSRAADGSLVEAGDCLSLALVLLAIASNPLPRGCPITLALVDAPTFVTA